MDPIKNPFSPGAGSPPPELVGRDPVLEQARVLLGRVKAKRPEKSMLLTGLRGVGKTVLLNEVERLALAEGWHAISIEAHENKALAPLIASHLRRLLFDLDRIAGAGDKVKRGLAVLRSFIGSIKITVDDVNIGLDIEPEKGAAARSGGRGCAFGGREAGVRYSRWPRKCPAEASGASKIARCDIEEFQAG